MSSSSSSYGFTVYYARAFPPLIREKLLDFSKTRFGDFNGEERERNNEKEAKSEEPRRNNTPSTVTAGSVYNRCMARFG